MKVCMLATSFPNFKGDSRGNFIMKIVEALAKNIEEIKIITPYNHKYDKLNYKLDSKIQLARFTYMWPKRFQKLDSEGGILVSLRKSLIAKLQFPLFFINFLITALKYSKDCDIIHANWTLSGLVGIIIKKLYSKPLILTLRGEDTWHVTKGVLNRKVFSYVLRNCDLVTSNNIASIAHIKKTFKNIRSKKLKVIHNGIDLNAFRPYDNRTARKKLRLPLNKKIILFIGWLIKRKGINYLLNAMPEIIKKDKDVLLILIGNGVERNELEEQTRRLKLDKYVSFLGAKKAEIIPRYINASDIFILPSLAEGMPNTVLEAMACGKPVISTNVGGVAEFIEDGKKGFLISPKEVGAISKTVNRIIKDNKLRKRIGVNARRTLINKKMSWEGCARKYINIYKKVLSR